MLARLLKKILFFISPQDETLANLGVVSYPASSAGTVSTSGDGTWGTYAQIVAAASMTADMLVTGAHITISVGDSNGAVAIATGATSSEVDRIYIPTRVAVSTDGLTVQFPHPILIPSGSRISCRYSAANTETATVTLYGRTGNLGF